MNQLKEAMLLLIANDALLGPDRRDHALKGDWQGNRECHMVGDFLLIYDIDHCVGKRRTISFVRAGTHSELFKCVPSRSSLLYPSRRPGPACQRMGMLPMQAQAEVNPFMARLLYPTK
ncbi:MAG: type II toxin-antitoxin system YafQ family toxin [Novosphingobium sp.]|uniref:type II toxin-antitoxin system YafQ family toxin n=1 Tax=Novosphingobium sp. TaxID=1874826 RepID=UPI0027368AFB|nr:type II toxin-antitoxin system YafQ family toxin [Novosphingobium sp.]MDP3551092.1 type II toxin-antitoxin system YafQ family toxin [Novosphingobium sp.]